MKTFLALRDLRLAEINKLLHLARHLELNPIQTTLRDKVVGLVFMNPSLRTLASMQTGVAQLGGTSVVLQPGAGSWALETREGVTMDGVAVEHVRDAFPVMGQYFDMVATRCFASGTNLEEDLADRFISQIAELSDKPFINLESAANHPCQALADWKSLDDVGVPSDGKFVISWAWHPKPLPYAVPLAAAEMALLRGMELTLLVPEGFQLPAQAIASLQGLSSRPLHTTRDRGEALEDATAVYVKSWASPTAYGNPAADAAARADLQHWCVSEDWYATAKPNAHFMHCLPMRRNVEATDALVEGPRSLTLRQAANRLHVQKAVMTALMENE